MSSIRRAIISVYDKSGVVDFALGLKELGVEIISTGGTAAHLSENGIEITSISSVTGFPEILDGRVKTLHPLIYGGLLSVRENEAHMQEVAAHNIGLIDLVVVNLYPFEQAVSQPEVTLENALENIDIGGPCMVRAAAKNYVHVAVVTSPGKYQQVLEEMQASGGVVSLQTRKELAVAAFARTSQYDGCIAAYLTQSSSSEVSFSNQLDLSFTKVQELRYGENPHQKAAVYAAAGAKATGLLKARQIHGKELSYNNLIDADAALGIVQEFDEPCVAIIKHTNPCGVAIDDSLARAYDNARATDPVSAFGGIVGLNRPVDAELAKTMSDVFLEVIIAPEFSKAAQSILAAKKNIRLLELPEICNKRSREFELKRVQGGILVQDQDFQNIRDINFRVVSKRQPSADEWTALKFAWRVCKWVKSNAIVYAKKDRTIGIGAGQMSRVDSSDLAVEKATRASLDVTGAVVASDAFFPFRDGVDVAAEAGASALIQPGGSIRDNDVIEAVDQHNMAMIFTGVRHFRH